MAWTLENWGRTPSPTDQRIIERKTVKITLARYQQIFEIVASDRQLREQLHWNNGVVSRGTDETVICTEIEWSDDSCFSVPRDGVFGFFLSEVLTNAVRHGKPGSQILFKVIENRIRNELTFSVENSVDVNRIGRTSDSPATKPFGGTVILRELARLSGWKAPQFECRDGKYLVQWSVAAIRRKVNEDGD